MTHIETISSLDDPRVADYRNVRDADLRGRGGLFVAEGRQVVRVLFGAERFSPRSVLLTEAALRSLGDVLDTRSDVPVYVAPQPVMSSIVGFDIHRGCLAIGQASGEGGGGGVESVIESAAAGSGVVIVIEGVNNHDNIGAIFRNAAAFGAGGCLLDDRAADPLYRKSIRVSMGATLLVPFARSTARADTYRALRAASFRIVALTPGADSEPLAASAGGSRAGGRVALVVGAEGPGLDREALEAADARVRIPIEPAVDSLNVATATAIALYQLRSGIALP